MTGSHCRRFVIVATQRSGSTLLVKSLDSAPSIFCAGEMFHGGPNTHHSECNYPQMILRSRLLGRIADRYLQAPRVRNHVRNFYSRHGAGMRAAGFKVMTSQLRSYDTLLPSLVALGTVRFYLYREDSFAAALSNFRARQSGVYHSDRGQPLRSSEVVTADLDEFQEHLKRSLAHKNELLDLHSEFGGVLLTYEGLVNQWEKLIAAIGDELGISQLRVGKVLDKLEGNAGMIRIGNLEELRQKFGRGTKP
jgi:LPS sulfotransferase NodH